MTKYVAIYFQIHSFTWVYRFSVHDTYPLHLKWVIDQHLNTYGVMPQQNNPCSLSSRFRYPVLLSCYLPLLCHHYGIL